MSDDVSGGIASLNRLFQRYCDTRPNVGGRLSMAKTKFSEAIYWLRINDEKDRERMMTDAATKELTHG
jgi:hypothetical protein